MTDQVESEEPAAAGTPRRTRVRDVLALFSPRRNLRDLFVAPAGNFRPVDGIRALSILWVVVFHCVWFLCLFISPMSYRKLLGRSGWAWIWDGDLGVDLFFMISGFLIGQMLMREHAAQGRIDVRRFYLRRIFRLMPAYLVCLGLYLLWRRPWGPIFPKDKVWANVLYVNNLLPFQEQCMGWTWSLAIEEQFYLTFPLFLFAFMRWPRARIPLLVGSLVASLAIRAWIVARHGLHLPDVIRLSPALDPARYVLTFDVLYDKPWGRFGAVFCGVAAAWGFALTDGVRRIGRSVVAQLVLFGVAAALLFLLSQGSHPLAPPTGAAATGYLVGHRHLLAGAGALILVLSLSARGPGRALGRLLSWRPLYPVAQLSYSAYLLHPMVIIGLYRRYPPGDATAWTTGDLVQRCLLNVGATFAAAAVIYLLVERPFMNLRRLVGWAR